MLLSLLILRFCTFKCIYCVCVIFFSLIPPWWKYSTQNIIVPGCGHRWLKAFSPQSRNPLSTSFATGKAPKICRVSAAVIVLAQGPRTNPGKTRMQRRQNQSSFDSRSKMLCVRRFLMMAAQSNTGTYSGMLDLTYVEYM